MNINLDFNHGATLPVTDPRAQDFSDRMNAHIDAAFFAKRNAEARREYVGASAIGGDCLRAVQLGYLGVAPDPERVSGKMLRIFDTGHQFEDILVSWLRNAGFVLDTIDPKTGKQWGFSVLGGKGKGHLDGILRDGPLPIAYPALWECKALNEKGWQSVKKDGLHIAKPVYAGQVAIDQAYLKLHENPAVFTALNKNTEELHHELVPFDQPLAQEMSDRMARIVSDTQQQKMIPRPFSDRENFRCKHLCDFPGTCWKMSK